VRTVPDSNSNGLTIQFRGEVGERQVEDPSIGLGHVVDGMSQYGIAILSNE
jgi:hypothetical protein